MSGLQCEVCGKGYVFLTDISGLDHCNACTKLAYDAYGAIHGLAESAGMDFGRIIELAQGVDRQMEQQKNSQNSVIENQKGGRP